MNNTKIINQPDKSAVLTCLNLLRELIIRSDSYNISPARFNSLVKAYYTLESLPVKKITGYIDISANTHLQGGGLDYSSFTIGENYFEIYTGFVKYEEGECDDSTWEKIYSSRDSDHRKSVEKALKCWAESFLLHLEENPARSLLIVDRSALEGDESVKAELTPDPKTIVPEYSYMSKNSKFDEAPF